MSSVQSIDNWCIECVNKGKPHHHQLGPESCGNERADQASMEAVMRPAVFIPVPYRDWIPLIKEKTYCLWNETLEN